MKYGHFTPLSEGHTVITKGLNGPGQCMHASEQNEYVTLYLSRTENDDFVEVANEEKIRIQVGKNMKTFIMPVTCGMLISNLHVYCGEEVWIAATIPNKYIIHGFASRSPLHSY